MGCRAVVFVYIFVAIIQGLIWGFIAQIISENKGYEDGFFWGFFLGIIGLIVVACKPDNNSSYDSAVLSKAAEEKELKRPLEKNKELVKKAEKKISRSVRFLISGKPTQEGIDILYRMAGFFGQRLYLGHKTKNYSDKLHVDEDKCIGCGKCEKLCPMNNIKIVDKKVVQNNQCTMCYRCINNCSKQAMTLLGKTVVERSVIEKYL
ncbi:MAG TPA: hypothetical protein DCM21_00520 [Butyrivibrio sp.]|nr:hypothetical protein [Butyrivibrio sp.]